MVVRSPRPTPGPPAQGSIDMNISPHNFWLQKPAGIESGEKLLDPQAVPLKNPNMDSPTHTTTSKLQLINRTAIIQNHQKSSSMEV